jgi:hypothetical protein
VARPHLLLSIGLCVLLPPGIAACGDDQSASSAGATTATAVAPEDVIAPDAVVARGLKRMAAIADRISAADGPAGKRASAGLEPVWRTIEGTVKRSEPDRYATIEEDLSLLSSGDPARARAGADELDATVRAYLARHPG